MVASTKSPTQAPSVLCPYELSSMVLSPSMTIEREAHSIASVKRDACNSVCSISLEGLALEVSLAHWRKSIATKQVIHGNGRFGVSCKGWFHIVADDREKGSANQAVPCMLEGGSILQMPMRLPPASLLRDAVVTLEAAVNTPRV